MRALRLSKAHSTAWACMPQIRIDCPHSCVQGWDSPKGFVRSEISMLNSCRSVDLFQRVNMVNEGTYGMVFRCSCAQRIPRLNACPAWSAGPCLHTCWPPAQSERHFQPSAEPDLVLCRAKLKSDPKSFYALKRIKLAQEKHGFPVTSLREINILLSLHHANIVNVTEVSQSSAYIGECTCADTLAIHSAAAASGQCCQCDGGDMYVRA